MEQVRYFEKNLLALKERDKTLHDAVLNFAAEEENIQLELVSAKDGSGITKLIKDGKEWYLNSQYRPVQEAEKFVEQYNTVVDDSIMVFLGFSNGIIARQLQQIVEEHVTLLFYEPSPMVFLHTLEHFDVTQIIERPQTQLFVKGLNDVQMEECLGTLIQYENYKLCSCNALPKYKQIFSQEYEMLQEKYRFAVNRVAYIVNTRKRWGRIIVRNNIYNMRYLIGCNCREDLVGVFPKDMPAIIVAAGPSLEKNVHLLEKAKGKAFIIAVDTAMRYLAEQDIQPDLVTSVDPMKPITVFDSEKIQQTPVAFNISLNHQVLEKMVGHQLICVSAESEYFDSVFQLAGKHIDSLRTGGSVATSTVTLAKSWGFNRIVLVGQDLALSPDKVHAGKDDIDVHKLTGKQIPVEGYYGETVYTSPDYDQYRKWFEQFIRNDDTIEIINATEGGAKIKGAVQMSLAEVIDTYCTRSFDFEGVIRNLPPAFTEEHRPQLLEMWKASVSRLVNMKRRLKEGARCAQQGMWMFEYNDYTPKKINDIDKKINKILTDCNAMDEIYFLDFIIEGQEGDTLEDIYKTAPGTAEEFYQALEKLKNYMEAMESAIDEVKGLFEDLITEVSNA